MILHIITSLENGGAEALLDTLLRSDGSEEHAVISLFSEGFYGEGLKKFGVPVHALNMPRSRVTLSGVTTLYKLVKQYKPEVIHTWMYHANLMGGLIGRAAGCRRIVWSLHNADMDPAGTSRSMHICNSLCARMSSRLPKSIVHSSQTGADLHISIGYDADKMIVVPGGYDLTRFKPDAESRSRVRDELGVPESLSLIGMIARWNPQKDHPNLLKALSLLDPELRATLKVALVGDEMNHDNKVLVELINELGIAGQVLLLGPRRDMPDLMNALDVHVLSSAFGESFPNVVNESMACGVPNIVTDVGDSALIVDKTGWVVEPKNAQALSMAITTALSELGEPSWQARKDACRDRVLSNFSIASMLKKYHRIWDATGAK